MKEKTEKNGKENNKWKMIKRKTNAHQTGKRKRVSLISKETSETGEKFIFPLIYVYK